MVFSKASSDVLFSILRLNLSHQMPPFKLCAMRWQLLVSGAYIHRDKNLSTDVVLHSIKAPYNCVLVE
jgi:hypothetical protein